MDERRAHLLEANRFVGEALGKFGVRLYRRVEVRLLAVDGCTIVATIARCEELHLM